MGMTRADRKVAEAIVFGLVASLAVFVLAWMASGQGLGDVFDSPDLPVFLGLAGAGICCVISNLVPRGGAFAH